MNPMGLMIVLELICAILPVRRNHLLGDNYTLTWMTIRP